MAIRPSEHTKHLFLLIGAQTGCVAIALWMQHFYVCSLAREAMEDQAYTAMADAIEDAESAIIRRGGDAVREDGGGQEVPGPVRRIAPSQAIHLVRMDKQWRILSSINGHDAERTVAPAVGKRLVWTERRRRADFERSRPGTRRGTVDLPDGPHLALVRAMPDGEGFILAHRSRKAVAAQATAVLPDLALAGTMTLAWTFALLGMTTFLIESRAHDRALRERRKSEAESLARMRSLAQTRDAVVFGLAKLAESRDPETGDHLERIGIFSSMLSDALRRDPSFADRVSPVFVRLIRIGAVLHDIGKVGVPDSILLKRDPLTKEERATIQTHAVIGGECLKEIEQRLGSSNFLQMAREIAFAHHERWDGSGYPNGLVGEETPLAARIVAIADVYDALYSKRIYKDALPHAHCVEIIRDGAGKHFDPEIVRVWLTIESRVAAIAHRYAASTDAAAPSSAGGDTAASGGRGDAEKPALVSAERDRNA
ncbi:MAG: HD domain-containing protein [Planctomycetes bacterium]|nr:HD domain-containing protein [Planctomycetota bacterium]